MSIGVGPRFPVGQFSNRISLGMGIDLAFSYTDNKYLPVFLYTKFGYQHFPGDMDFYKNSNYSAFSSTLFSIDAGARYFFNPLLRNIVLLMPIAEVGLSYSFLENYHEFKLDKNQNNFFESISKFGFHVGAGFSMFLLDVMTNYYYYSNSQFISFDLRLRIPIFVTM